MSDRIANKVYMSKQYSKFSPFLGNRGQTAAHSANLMKSMKEHGWIDSLPMTVKAKGGKFDILDGHNRFYAARALKIPVKYAVVNGEVSDPDIYLINRTQRRWTTEDFIKSYANMGYGEYKEVRMFMENHHVRGAIACAFLSQSPSVSMGIIESGKFRCLDVVWADMHVSYLLQINASVRWSLFKSNFVRVFIAACKLDKFDANRLVKQIAKNPQLVVDYATKKDLAIMMEDVYNHGYAKKNKVPLAFYIEQGEPA